MMFIFIIGLIWLVTATLQFRLMRLHPIWRRTLGFVLTTSIFICLLPPLLHWQKVKEIPVEEAQIGVLLWDRSASCEGLLPEQAAVVERARQRSGVELVEFSKGVCAPLGDARLGGGSDLHLALEELRPVFEERAPDWIWMVTDGGFTQTPLPEWLLEHPLFFSAWSPKEQGVDVSVRGLETDPVWYARHDNELRIFCERNTTGDALSVDLLIRMNGHLVKSTQAFFKKGEQQAEVRVVLKAEHLGVAHVEVHIAEGQGGEVVQNDHRHLAINVLRDRVRVLRVVGRPNWSSKFLRDQLVMREDIDLVDFHILRAIEDRVLARTEELALIPFPVDELFVENIDSFDLIIWQNFDHRSYPFFKEVFISNIVRAVESGCGLMLWNGSLPWTLQEGQLSRVAPKETFGARSQMVEGILSAEEGTPFHELLQQKQAQLSPFELNIFDGKLKPDTQVLLRSGDQPLITCRDHGRGRVLQVSSDDLWRLNFEAKSGMEGLYSTILKKSLMWLQHHPDAQTKTLPWPKSVYVGTKLPLPEGIEVEWKQVRSEASGELEVMVKDGQVVVPSRPGVYEVGERGGPYQTLAVVGYQDEFLTEKERVSTFDVWRKTGVSELDLKTGFPISAQQVRSVRRIGTPWHVSPLYMITMLSLLLLQWLVMGRALEFGTRGVSSRV